MGQPTPPGDMPLYEGLPSEWNDIVGAFPEDKRGELAPLLKSRLDAQAKQYEPLKQWEQFSNSGLSPEQVSTAINIQRAVETNPQGVYEAIGKSLGISPQQAKEVVEEVDNQIESGNDDPRLATMQKQLNTMAEILLGNHQQDLQSKQAAEADAWLEKQMGDLKKKYGDVNEREIIMRMSHMDMSAEEAYQDYTNMVSELRRSRPSPMIMGNGGMVPRNTIDPTKLDSAGTKNLVAQMLEHAAQESK